MPQRPVRTIGSFELLEEVSRGTQGVVHRARQAGTHREVALKRLLAGSWASAEKRARFEREIEAASALNHPNIVTVYGIEILDDVPMLAMEWIDGIPLHEWSAGDRQRRRPVRELLEMFVSICDAIKHAHLHGVIHRDLKPNNILVDADGRPHVLDFGLAKFSGSQLTSDAGMTQTGEFIGTPAYASPEQVRLEHDRVDARTDLYSLGVILFQMLTNEMPYPIVSDIRTLVDTIEHTPPQRPSRIDAHIDRELDSIVLKALAKEHAHRYQSADAFAADIRRYLSGESVLAHPPSTLYQVRKLISRHRLPFAFAATVAGLVIAFAVVSGVMAVRIAEQRDQAQTQRARADEMTEEAEARTREADWKAYLANLAAANAALLAGDTLAAQTARRRLDHVVPSLINWEWWRLARRMDRIDNPGGPRDLLAVRSASPLRCIAFGPDGLKVAAGRADGIVSVYAADTLGTLFELSGHAGAINALVFDPAARAGLASGGEDGTVRLWDTSAGRPQRILAQRSAEVLSLAYEPHARRLAAGYADGVVAFWSVDSGESSASFNAHDAGISALFCDPLSGSLVTGGLDGFVRVWRLPAAEEIAIVQTRDQPVHALAVSPDGTLLACGLGDGRILLARFPALDGIVQLEGHQKQVTGLSFSPDGTRIVSVSDDTTLRLWDVARREEVLMLRGEMTPLSSVAFSPDGARIATAADDGTLRILEGKMSAVEFVRQMAEDHSPAEIIKSLEADDALEKPLREVALRIAHRMLAGDAATRP